MLLVYSVEQDQAKGFDKWKTVVHKLHQLYQQAVHRFVECTEDEGAQQEDMTLVAGKRLDFIIVMH